MKIILLIFFVSAPAFSQGQVADVVISTSARSVEQIYNPVKKRDPLTSSPVFSSKTDYNTVYEAASKVEKSTESVSSSGFSFVGIMDFSGKKEALVKDDKSLIYICKGGLLYGPDKKPLKNFSCEIKSRQIVIKDDKKNSHTIYWSK